MCVFAMYASMMLAYSFQLSCPRKLKRDYIVTFTELLSLRIKKCSPYLRKRMKFSGCLRLPVAIATIQPLVKLVSM